MTEYEQNDLRRLNIAVVDSSGLFDREWYVATYPELAGQADALVHFCEEGWRQGMQPNPYFDSAWYVKTYGDELSSGENPLLHYIRRGERENAWPSPHFDPEWYRDEYGLGNTESPLRHYLLNRSSGTVSPLPGFDAPAYVKEHPECAGGEQDPYLHWLEHPKEQPAPPRFSESPLAVVLSRVGAGLERSLEQAQTPEAVPWENFKDALRLFIPHIPFDEEWYCAHYPDVAAAVKCGLIPSAHGHFVDYGFFEGRSPAPAPRWKEFR
jgi:hypothetical protein